MYMERKIYALVLIFLFAVSGIDGETFSDKTVLTPMSRRNFPDGFIFGTASASYQYEGAAHEGGRGPSIWDTFAENHPERIRDRSNGTVAIDSYYRYKNYVSVMKETGFDSHRFSISWSRILPNGTLAGGINEEGVNFYNNFINELLENGLKPFVTLFHWDTPQALEDAYGGFLHAQIVDDFRDYAEICFVLFGDRVKRWITLNEPVAVAKSGYATGVFAPGRCSSYVNTNCFGGDSAIEPYIVGHNQLLAHGAAVKVYKSKYKAIQEGEIGITLSSFWRIPNTDSHTDRLAANRDMAFQLDWFLEPINSGKYPVDMVNYLNDRLPKFTKEESEMLRGSYDFVGLNYYAAIYVQDVPCRTVNMSYTSDSCVNMTVNQDAETMTSTAVASSLAVYPKGIRDLLLYTKYKFNDPIIYITENGYSEADNDELSLNDTKRVEYYRSHLQMVHSAILAGAKVKGYFAWSLLDNLEWANGYTVRFGMFYVDYTNNLKLYYKKSALWFKHFLLPQS